MPSLRIYLLPAPGAVLIRSRTPFGVEFRRLQLSPTLPPAALYELAASEAVARWGACECQGVLWDDS